MTEFQRIDLSDYATGSARQARELAMRVDEICRETGFLAITGHGVPGELIRRVWHTSQAFFDLPESKKLKVKSPVEGYPYGYFPLQAESLARSRGEVSPPDLKESFNIGPLTPPPGVAQNTDTDFCFAPNLWPDEPADFRSVWIDYYAAMGALAAIIMRIFALALDLREDYFDDKTDHCTSAMRALNYPHQTSRPEPGQLRAGAHTDYGSLTILLPDATSDGLEILTPSAEWQSVPACADTFVINIGDLMARWTNDRWVSTMHRVVNPAGNQEGSTRRQSIVFFQQPNWDAEIACIPTCLAAGEQPRYSPVTSGRYLMDRFSSTVEPQASDLR